MTLKAIIIAIFCLGTIAYAMEHPWSFGAFIAGFAMLIWIGYKLDKGANS